MAGKGQRKNHEARHQAQVHSSNERKRIQFAKDNSEGKWAEKKKQKNARRGADISIQVMDTIGSINGVQGVTKKSLAYDNGTGERTIPYSLDGQGNVTLGRCTSHYQSGDFYADIAGELRRQMPEPIRKSWGYW